MVNLLRNMHGIRRGLYLSFIEAYMGNQASVKTQGKG